LWLPLGTIGMRTLVRSPDPADGERAMMAVSSEVVTARTAAVRTWANHTVLTKKKGTQLKVPYAGPVSNQYRRR